MFQKEEAYLLQNCNSHIRDYDKKRRLVREKDPGHGPVVKMEGNVPGNASFRPLWKAGIFHIRHTDGFIGRGESRAVRSIAGGNPRFPVPPAGPLKHNDAKSEVHFYVY